MYLIQLLGKISKLDLMH